MKTHRKFVRNARPTYKNVRVIQKFKTHMKTPQKFVRNAKPTYKNVRVTQKNFFKDNWL
jgi:hypothetical protein